MRLCGCGGAGSGSVQARVRVALGGEVSRVAAVAEECLALHAHRKDRAFRHGGANGVDSLLQHPPALSTGMCGRRQSLYAWGGKSLPSLAFHA